MPQAGSSNPRIIERGDMALNRHRRRLIWMLALAIVASLAVPFLLGGRSLLQNLPKIRADWLALMIGMVLLGWVFNSFRMQILAKGMGSRLPAGWRLGAVIATEFAGAASPAGAGGALTYVALLKQKGIRTAHAAAMYAIDHFMDGVFFAVAFPVALLSLALHGGFSNPAWLVAVTLSLFGLGAAVFWLLLRQHRLLIRLLGRVLKPFRLSVHRQRRLARWLMQFRQGVRLVLQLPRWQLLLLFMFCAAHWLLQYSILAVAISLIGASVPWSYLFAVQGVLLLFGQISVLPGGAGGVELGYAALLAPFLDVANIGFSLLLWRLMTYHFYLVAGLPVFLMMLGGHAWRLLSPTDR
ncbi:MAG: lysylphosphatidylglycerol synthase transmembrane domain-containing protein [Halothiobacillus sp.]